MLILRVYLRKSVMKMNINYINIITKFRSILGPVVFGLGPISYGIFWLKKSLKFYVESQKLNFFQVGLGSIFQSFSLTLLSSSCAI